MFQLKQCYLLLLLIFIITIAANAQETVKKGEVPVEESKVVFSYDTVGNRIQRETIIIKIEDIKEYSIDTILNQVAEMVDDSTENAFNEESEIFGTVMNGSEIKIYPNPTNGLLKIELSSMDDLKTSVLQLYNISGSLIEQKEQLQNKTVLDLSKIAKGNYIMLIRLDGNTHKWKIVKE